MIENLAAYLPDVAAALLFFACSMGFGKAAEFYSARRPGIVQRMRGYRHRWIVRSCERDNHISDATIMSNLLRGALFFASTTVLILGGLVAFLGTGTKVVEIVAQFPVLAATDPRVAEVKAVVAILLFVYAFFQFSWSAWQYNILAIIMGGAPFSNTSAEEKAQYISTASAITALAGDSYNNGIRAYYFSVALMAWFVDTRAFCLATIVVTLILFRREFASPTLAALKDLPGS